MIPGVRTVQTVAICAVACVAAFASGKWIGAKNERARIELRMAQEALDRINGMVKNNEKFLSLSDRDRCIVFMRDSGLPDDACD